MTLFEAVRSFILADSVLGPKLGNARVYPSDLPQNVQLPAVVMRRTSGEGYATLQGASGMNSVRIRLDWWDLNIKQAEQCINRLQKQIASFNGLLGGAGGVKFATISFNGPRDNYHPISRCSGIQLDILGHVDEDTIS